VLPLVYRATLTFFRGIVRLNAQHGRLEEAVESAARTLGVVRIGWIQS